MCVCVCVCVVFSEAIFKLIFFLTNDTKILLFLMEHYMIKMKFFLYYFLTKFNISEKLS